MKQFSHRRLAEALDGHRRETVAGYVGVTERTLRNWLDGKGEPRATQLHYIVALTGKKWAFFFQEGAA